MSRYIAEWRQREVVEEIKAQVADNIEAACYVVESDARRRLLRVSEPTWGRKYRTLLALGRLTSFVVQEGQFVEGRIGIPAGEKGGEYGFWIEIGNVNWPAHPWLRPALFQNLREILKLVGGG